MKAEQYNIINQEVKKNLISRIIDIECDGKTKVTIGGIGTKSQRQQGLDWKWDGEVFKSGIGWHDDSVEVTHSRSKWLFARPILLRDDEVFAIIDNHFIAHYGSDLDKCLAYARDYISTQRMTVSQVAEYMTAKQAYWIGRGVELTNPDDYGLEYK